MLPPPSLLGPIASSCLNRKNKLVDDSAALRNKCLLLFCVIALFSLPVCLHTHSQTKRAWALPLLQFLHRQVAAMKCAPSHIFKMRRGPCVSGVIAAYGAEEVVHSSEDRFSQLLLLFVRRLESRCLLWPDKGPRLGLTLSLKSPNGIKFRKVTSVQSSVNEGRGRGVASWKC